MSLRFHAAVFLGKFAKLVLSLIRSGGDALPGLIVERVDRNALARLAGQCTDGVIVISGTNGKTTTSRMIAEGLSLPHEPLVHNRSGSNMTRGHISAFLEQTGWNGRVNARMAVLETDEAVLPVTLAITKPKLVLLHNLFRDQLDRYGEVDSIAAKWLSALLASLPSSATLVVDGDDPNLANLARKLGHGATRYYGVDDPKVGEEQPTATSDAYLSPVSGKPLSYAVHYLSHLGDFSDPASEFRRPPLDFMATNIVSDTRTHHTTFVLRDVLGNMTELSLTLPGIYNLYNGLAAASSLIALGKDMAVVKRALTGAAGVFGRFETIDVYGKELVLCLIKNPAGATEVLRTVAEETKPYSLALIANDNYADGLDVSWYWDTRFEVAIPQARGIFCGGTRAADMGLRAKYAGATCPITLVGTTEQTVRHALDAAQPGQPVYVLSTYTATLEVQKTLQRMGIKSAYWKE